MTTTTITPRDADHLTFTVTTTDDRGNVSATWIDLAELLAAVNGMADTLSEAATDAGSAFSCTEAETLAAVLRAGGRLDAAEDWLAGHGEGDDEGDSHYVEDPADVEHREAGKCGWVSPSGYRCGHPAEANGYCITHAHLAGQV